MSRLVDVLKEIGKFEIGYNEWPAVKKMFTNLPRDLAEKIQEGDPANTATFFAKYGISLIEISHIVDTLSRINPNSGNLDVLLDTTGTIAIAESSKYLLGKLARYLENLNYRIVDYLRNYEGNDVNG